MVRRRGGGLIDLDLNLTLSFFSVLSFFLFSFPTFSPTFLKKPCVDLGDSFLCPEDVLVISGESGGVLLDIFKVGISGLPAFPPVRSRIEATNPGSRWPRLLSLLVSLSEGVLGKGGLKGLVKNLKKKKRIHHPKAGKQPRLRL